MREINRNNIMNGMRNLSSELDVKSIVIYDDNYNSFNKFAQQNIKHLSGKVRCFLPGALLSEHLPIHIIVLVPPYYEELEFAMNARKAVNYSIHDFHCWLMHDSKLIDISRLVELGRVDEYNKLVATFEKKPIVYSNSLNEDSYSLITKQLLTTISQPSLILPFETRLWHYSVYRSELKSGSVKLFSPVDRFVDKALAAELILKANPGLASNYTNPKKVIAPLANSAISLPTDAHGSEVLASKIIDHCSTIESMGNKAYIKLDSQGADGIDNISPIKYPEVYEGEFVTRIERLSKLIHERFSQYNTFPCKPMVEERITASKDELGTKEYIISGIFHRNTWNLWSITRAITDQAGRYLGAIGSSSHKNIGINDSEYVLMKSVVEESAYAMGASGYEAGYISKDAMLDIDESLFKIHDHNDRRGGRSFLEVLTKLYPNKVFIDKIIEVSLSTDASKVRFVREAFFRPFYGNQFFCIYGTSSLYQATNDSKVKIYIVASVPLSVIHDSKIEEYIELIVAHTNSLANGV